MSASKPYTYWIHCNRCFEEHIKKEKTFFLLACQHISCGTCLVEIKQDVNGPRTYRCPICQKDVRGCEINNTMPKHLKELFHPEPYLDGLNTFNIVTFQAEHRRRYLEHLEKDQIAIREEVKNTEKIKDDCKKIYQELQELKAERKRLERRVIAIRQQRKRDDDNRLSNLLSSSSFSNISAPSSSGSRRMPRASPEPNSDDVVGFGDNNQHNSFLF